MDVTNDPTRRAECVQRVMDWLGYCVEVMNEGEEAVKVKLTPDPFYGRNAMLTEAVVDAVIKEIEFEVIEYELSHYPNYHYTAQGTLPGERLVRPGFDALPYEARLSLVQGVDQVLQGYRT